MMLLRDSTVIAESCKGAVLALGNFDGLHLGHQAIINETVSLARASGKKAGVMTFEPHPRRVFNPALAPLRVLALREKFRLLAEHGIDFLRVVRFTRAFAETSAEDFVTRILHRQMQASHIVTGEDFTFGHQRGGNVAFLKAKGGLKVTACPPVLLDGERCSSTRLRGLLAEGDMQAAERLMNRPYRMSGIVRGGDRRGHALGFPTANIVPHGVFIPAHGVYAVRAQIDGRMVDGAAHLGTRPVFNSMQVRLETHFFDFSGDLYGKRLNLKFIACVRGHIDIAGEDALKRQIEDDCAKARVMLGFKP